MHIKGLNDLPEHRRQMEVSTNNMLHSISAWGTWDVGQSQSMLFVESLQCGFACDCLSLLIGLGSIVISPSVSISALHILTNWRFVIPGALHGPKAVR